MIKTPTNKTPNPNVAELALSMAASGKSWDEFTDSVTDRLIGLIPDKRKSDVPSDSEKPLRGVRALYQHYEMSTATLNKMMKNSKIPHRHVGNRYLLYVSEVDAYIIAYQPRASRNSIAAMTSSKSKEGWVYECRNRLDDLWTDDKLKFK